MASRLESKPLCFAVSGWVLTFKTLDLYRLGFNCFEGHYYYSEYDPFFGLFFQFKRLPVPLKDGKFQLFEIPKNSKQSHSPPELSPDYSRQT